MDCIFCHKEKLVTDIVYEDNLVMAFMDMEPINEGHVLLVPKEHYLNFSAGICSNFVVEDKTDMSSVMQNADKALFAAKNSGRSRTVLWTEMP